MIVSVELKGLNWLTVQKGEGLTESIMQNAVDVAVDRFGLSAACPVSMLDNYILDKVLQNNTTVNAL